MKSAVRQGHALSLYHLQRAHRWQTTLSMANQRSKSVREVAGEKRLVLRASIDTKEMIYFIMALLYIWALHTLTKTFV